MSQKAGRYPLPEDAYPLLIMYHQLYQATGGKMTPLIGQVMADAGYDANYSLKPSALYQPPAWDDVITYNQDDITLSQPALLDFGAAGKGYLVDIIGKLLEGAGITDYYVNAGGDMSYHSTDNNPLRVGLENPTDQEQVIGVASISNQSLCASSGSRRSWGKFHHIIDPETLESPQDIIATWVVAQDTMTADGLATALYFASPETLRQQFEFSYALLRSNMSLEQSRDFPAKIYKADV
jgi:thiamine biosynthesis lipoprotein